MPQSKESIEKSSEVPYLKEIEKELEQAITDSWDFYRRNQQADDTRYCRWDGQSDDGRKHEANLNKKPFPWENASDTRIRLADEIVNEHVRLLKTAFFKSKVQSAAIGTEDIQYSQSMTRLLGWMFQSRLLREMRREIELLAQWRQHYGSSILWLSWHQETRWELNEVTIDALAMMAQQQAQQGDDSLLQMLELLMDPANDETAAEYIRSLADWLTLSEAKDIVEGLRTEGVAEFPRKYTFANCPKWEACRTAVDVLFPRMTADLQNARVIFKNEFVSQTDLENRIESEGYDKAFVEEAVKHKGEISQDEFIEWMKGRNKSTRSGFLTQDYKEYIELKHAYYKAHHKGGTKVFCTIYHPLVKEKYAKHEADVYDHGMYPCLEFVREWGGENPTIMDSRGISELSMTEQMEIKTQRDARMDRTSLGIRPPVRHPLNRGKFELLLGPGVNVPERKPNEIGLFQTPVYDPTSKEVEVSVKAGAANYHGLIDETVLPTKLQLFQQDLVDSWLVEIGVAMGMTFQMMEQYMDEEEVQRVVGPLSQPWKRSRQDIQRQYDVVVTFDVRDLDTEFVMKKLETLNKAILPMDTQGVIDRAGIMKDAMGVVDTRWAELYVKPAAAAAQSEIEDEQAAFSKIAAGTEPPLKDSGQNFALRKQTLEQIFMANPAVQQRYGQDKIFQKMMKTRMEHFNFMLQQQQNAQIGRIGVKPALEDGIGAI